MIRTLLFVCALMLVTLGRAQTIYYNGANLVFDRNTPMNSRGVLMVPARDTAARIGAFFERNESGRRIDLTWSDNRAVYRQGDRTFQLNGRDYSAGGTSEDVNGVLYIPFEIFRRLTDDQLSTDRGGNRPNSRMQIYFDGRLLNFGADNAPYAKGGVTMVPFRALGDAIGARTGRTADGLRVTIDFDGQNVEYDKGHIWFRLNGQRRELKVTSEERGSVLFVPIGLFNAVSRGRVSTSQSDNRPDGNWPNDGLQIYLDGRALNLSGDNAPYTKQGVTMVPFRALGDAIGARTGRTSDGLRVTIDFDGQNVEYDKGHIWFRLNGQRRELKTTSEDRRSILFVPIGLYNAVSRGRVTTR